MGFNGPDYTAVGKKQLKNVILYSGDGEDAVALGGSSFNPLQVDPGEGRTVRLVDASGTPLIVSAGGILSVAADTELPTARLAADNLALPTAPDVLAVTMISDGTTLDMWREPTATGTAVAAPGIGLVSVGLYAGSSVFRPWYDAVVGVDGLNGNGVGAVVPYAWNGATWDRPRANYTAVGLASAARVATTSTPDQVNYNGVGCRVFLNVTVVPGVETLTLTIEVKDPIAGSYTAILTGAVVVAVTENIYTVYPGVTLAANLAVSTPLSRTWRATISHSASGSFTYSVAMENLL